MRRSDNRSCGGIWPPASAWVAAFLVVRMLASDALASTQGVVPPGEARATRHGSQWKSLEQLLEIVRQGSLALDILVEYRHGTESGASVQRRARWIRSGPEWCMVSGGASESDASLPSPAVDAGAEFVIVGAADGSALVRVAGAPTRLVEAALPPLQFHAIGLLDQTLDFTVLFPSSGTALRFDGLTSVESAEGPDGTTWTVRLSSSQLSEVLRIRFADHGGTRRIDFVSSELERQLPDGTAEFDSRSTATVTAWAGSAPASVELKIERADPATGVRHWNASSIAVVAQGHPPTQAVLSGEIESRRRLIPGEELIIEARALRMKEGSALFTVGGETYLAPTPLVEVPHDVARLVATSRKVPRSLSERERVPK